MPLVDPCQGGMTGHCKWGRHERCGNYEIRLPSGYLTDRKGYVVSDERGYVAVLPEHVWRCSCTCHR